MQLHSETEEDVQLMGKRECGRSVTFFFSSAFRIVIFGWPTGLYIYRKLALFNTVIVTVALVAFVVVRQ